MLDPEAPLRSTPAGRGLIAGKELERVHPRGRSQPRINGIAVETYLGQAPEAVAGDPGIEIAEQRRALIDRDRRDLDLEKLDVPQILPCSLQRHQLGALLRLVTALQTSDKSDVYTPEGWRPGDPVLVPPPFVARNGKGTAPTTGQTDWYFRLEPAHG
jgi:hypothetical protein